MNELVGVGDGSVGREVRRRRGGFSVFFFSFSVFFFSNSVMAFLMMLMLMRLRYVPLGIHFSSSRVC